MGCSFVRAGLRADVTLYGRGGQGIPYNGEQGLVSGNGNARQQGLGGDGNDKEPRASDECGVPSTPTQDAGRSRTADRAVRSSATDGRTLGRRPLSAAPSLRFPSFATTCEQTNT